MLLLRGLREEAEGLGCPSWDSQHHSACLQPAHHTSWPHGVGGQGWREEGAGPHAGLLV